MQELEVRGGDDFRDASFLQISDVTFRLGNIKVEELMQQLLAVVAIKDKVLCHALDISVSGTPCANHCCYHQNGLVRDHTRNIFDVGLRQTTFFRVACACL